MAHIPYVMTHIHYHRHTYTIGWLELVGSIKVYVTFTEYRLFHGAFLRKRFNDTHTLFNDTHTLFSDTHTLCNDTHTLSIRTLTLANDRYVVCVCEWQLYV